MSHTFVIPDVLCGAPSLAQGTDLNALEKEISAMSIRETPLGRAVRIKQGTLVLSLVQGLALSKFAVSGKYCFYFKMLFLVTIS